MRTFNDFQLMIHGHMIRPRGCPHPEHELHATPFQSFPVQAV